MDQEGRLRCLLLVYELLYGAANGTCCLTQGHGRRLQRMWRQMPFAAALPFHHSRGQESGYVLAFEVELQHVCGLDYSNPLILDGRMVIEAKHVVKREFLTVRILPGLRLAVHKACLN